MSKPFDPRVTEKARVGDIRLSLNLEIKSTEMVDDLPVESVSYLQQATINYTLVDTDGATLGARSLTHQTAGSANKPTLAQAILSVGQQLRGWITADRLALADDDT